VASFLACSAAVASLPQPSGAGSPARFLTTDPDALDYWPCFSPDGRAVLFSRSVDGRKTWELFVVPAAGGDARRLARSPSKVSATRASWSSRSKLVAFTGTTADGKSSVWVMNPDGTNAHQLASAGLSDRVLYPSWYPNGKQLAVMDARDEVIKRIDLKAGPAVILTDHAEILTGMPSVSPDGKWIAFAGQKNTGQPYDQTKNSIWLVNGAAVLRTVEATPEQGRTPHWSPDGAWLAFESNRGSPSQSYAAFIINRDGTGLKQVTDYDLDANHPVWSPDGRRLAFSARHTKDRNATGIAIIDLPKSH
jgi:Tol biopolymer transport system component